MLRTLFVTGSLVHGGAERHSITLMNRLAERGHECHAVYVKNDPSQLSRIRLQGAGSAACLGAERYLDRRALAEFAARIARLQPSVIVAANAYALMYSFLARRLSGSAAPLVATYHSTLLLGFKEHVKMAIDRWFFRAADCLVFVCEAQRRYWARRGVLARRNEVIPNGIDLEHFRPDASAGAAYALRRHLGFSDHDLVIGMVAVLRPEKNHLQLLDAVASLRRRGIRAAALLIGDGAMRPAIEAKARALGIASRVAITGFVEDVRPSVAACDAVALCSTTEALSLAALEAMAMGRPVVHSEVGGAAELIVPGKNGFLFPVGDTDALAGALARLADRDRADAMGRNARRIAETQYSEETMLNRYEETLFDVCAGSGTERRTTTGRSRRRGWRAFGNAQQSRSK